jgi:hypothetical protein
MRDRKNRIVIGTIIFAAGALIAVGPQSLFAICDQTHHMHEGHSICYWTARAEIGVGAVVALLGVGQAVFRDGRVRAGLNIGAAFGAMLAFALANTLIGMDESPMMDCRVKTLPALNVISVLTFAVALGNTVWTLTRAARAGGGAGYAATRVDGI